MSTHKEKSVECQTDDGLVAANHLRELLVALEASGAAPEAGKVWRDGNDGHGVDAADLPLSAPNMLMVRLATVQIPMMRILPLHCSTLAS